MRMMISCVLGLVFAATAADAEPVTLKAKKIIVAPGNVLTNSSVTIDGGKIVATGNDVAGAIVKDYGDAVITAGLIDASTRYGLYEVAAESATNEGRFGGDSINANYKAEHSINRDSVRLPILRKLGILSVVARPSGGLISGVGAWLDTSSPGTVLGPSAVYISLGQSAGNGSRGKSVAKLEQLFADAELYARRKAQYVAGSLRRLQAPSADLEMISRVLAKRLPVVFSAESRSEILTVVELTKRYGLKSIIEGGTEAWLVAKPLSAQKIPIVINAAMNLPRDFSRLGVSRSNLKKLEQAGVTIILSTRSSAPYDGSLRQSVGIAIANGLSYDAAIAAVTTNPAIALGQTSLGALQRGKRANVVVWSGDPFKLSTNVKAAYIDGKEQSLVTRHDRLFKRYRVLKD